MFDLNFAAIVTAMVITGTAQAATTVSVEAAGVQATTVRAVTGVESFDGVTRYTSRLNTNFGGSVYRGTFSDVLPSNANQYGGAGGTGRFETVQNATTLTLAGPQTNYFGLWASALDGGNSVAFYRAGRLLDTVNLVAQPLDKSYFGNPNTLFFQKNKLEKYAFFNFIVTGGYDKVVLIQNNGGGFELDNVTVGAAAVPEPASWAMLVMGFGLVGATVRRARVSVA